ncbi:hypothetical protein O181_107109, partial [Austropuccinia psidii MF-1]|nr:hypothetical protein [Austropuccinia psidii MF-1]
SRTTRACNQSFNLDDIANTIQDVRKRNNIGKHSPYRSSSFKEKQPLRVDFKDKPKERVSEVTKKKNSFNNYPREEFRVEYQEETPPEIQDIQLEAGIPLDTANKNLCKHTPDAQTFLITPTKGMAYIHETSTKVTASIDNSQHALIIDSGENCSIVARKYLDNNFPNWEKQLFPTKAKNFKSASGKTTSIGKIIKEIIIPHRKGNIRLNPEFVVHSDAHIQGYLQGKDYQRMYGIDIYNSENRHITIGTNNKKEIFTLYILNIYPLPPRRITELIQRGPIQQQPHQ